MFHKDQTTLIIALAIAGMLLLLLYSPWGSPDLYKKRVYFSENQGVNFAYIGIHKEYMHVSTIKAGISSIKSDIGSIKPGLSSIKSIPNAPKNAKPGEISNEIAIEDNYSKRQKHYTTSSASTETTHNNTIAYNSPKSAGLKSSDSNSTIGQSSSGVTSRSKSNSDNQSNSAQSFAPAFKISNDDSLINQSDINSTSANDSIVIDEMISPRKAGEPVPVPEGWVYLLALASIYIFFKQKLYKRFSKTFNSLK